MYIYVTTKRENTFYQTMELNQSFPKQSTEKRLLLYRLHTWRDRERVHTSTRALVYVQANVSGKNENRESRIM